MSLNSTSWIFRICGVYNNVFKTKLDFIFIIYVLLQVSNNKNENDLIFLKFVRFPKNFCFSFKLRRIIFIRGKLDPKTQLFNKKMCTRKLYLFKHCNFLMTEFIIIDCRVGYYEGISLQGKQELFFLTLLINIVSILSTILCKTWNHKKHHSCTVIGDIVSIVIVNRILFIILIKKIF